MKFAIRHSVTRDQYGLAVIEETGRCYTTDRAAIEAGCSWRYTLVALPETAGAIFKTLDGSRARLVDVTPATFSGRFRCVKVAAWCTPFAPVQTGGQFKDHAILSYTIRYQEAGSVA